MLFYLAYFFVQWEVEIASEELGSFRYLQITKVIKDKKQYDMGKLVIYTEKSNIEIILFRVSCNIRIICG